MSNKELAKAILQKWDKNQGGYAKRDDLQKVYKQLDPDTTDIEMKIFFDKAPVETDESGVININQFLEWVYADADKVNPSHATSRAPPEGIVGASAASSTSKSLASSSADASSQSRAKSQGFIVVLPGEGHVEPGSRLCLPTGDADGIGTEIVDGGVMDEIINQITSASTPRETDASSQSRAKSQGFIVVLPGEGHVEPGSRLCLPTGDADDIRTEMIDGGVMDEIINQITSANTPRETPEIELDEDVTEDAMTKANAPMPSELTSQEVQWGPAVKKEEDVTQVAAEAAARGSKEMAETQTTLADAVAKKVNPSDATSGAAASPGPPGAQVASQVLSTVELQTRHAEEMRALREELETIKKVIKAAAQAVSAEEVSNGENDPALAEEVQTLKKELQAAKAASVEEVQALKKELEASRPGLC